LVDAVEQVDSFDGTISGVIEVPADQLVFVSMRFRLNHVVENQDILVAFGRTQRLFDVFPQRLKV
jgi:hypothetical protein